MATVELEDVGKTYPGGVVAVKDASFAIKDGEFIVLVGPSGCGKSTILRMIAGLETITAGSVSIDGRVVNSLEPGERDIAMVFQNYALYPHMSVYKNMAYGLKNSGMAKDEIKKRIDKAAATLQLEDYLDRKPSQLSGGQRQRVAMGRAIVRQPKVFLFDEPLSNLDAKLRTHMRSELKTLHRDLGATFIFVTHDQVEAMSLADRIVIMSAGKIEQIGTPMELYHKPATRFVAEFIGSPPMNIFSLENGIAKQVTQSTDKVPEAARSIGLRPESFELLNGNNSGVKANVEMREVLGSDTLLHLRLEDDATTIIRVPSSVAEGASDAIKLRAKADQACWFDQDGSLLA